MYQSNYFNMSDLKFNLGQIRIIFPVHIIHADRWVVSIAIHTTEFFLGQA